jgi:hypothetical protein
VVVINNSTMADATAVNSNMRELFKPGDHVYISTNCGYRIHHNYGIVDRVTACTLTVKYVDNKRTTLHSDASYSVYTVSPNWAEITADPIKIFRLIKEDDKFVLRLGNSVFNYERAEKFDPVKHSKFEITDYY